MMSNLGQVIMADIRMTDYLLARGFMDRLVSRIERMTRYSGANEERVELENLMFNGKFEIYGKKVNHGVHWVELYDAYQKSQRMSGNAKMKLLLINGKKKRFTCNQIKIIMLDVIRKVEEISAKVLIKASQTPAQGAQGSPFAQMTNLGFKETTFEDVEVDLDFGSPPNKPIGLDEDEEEVSEVELAKHANPI